MDFLFMVFAQHILFLYAYREFFQHFTEVLIFTLDKDVASMEPTFG
jgi:hypothetical protein